MNRDLFWSFQVQVEFWSCGWMLAEDEQISVFVCVGEGRGVGSDCIVPEMKMIGK